MKVKMKIKAERVSMVKEANSVVMVGLLFHLKYLESQ